ncbi:MAG: hypothetical protein ACI85O_001739 [Saprospiraceae bacterium]|jgi:hypothetical protein
MDFVTGKISCSKLRSFETEYQNTKKASSQQSENAFYKRKHK